jgi:hypothetical protein
MRPMQGFFGSDSARAHQMARGVKLPEMFE